MFNPFKRSSQKETIIAGYRGFIAGLSAGISMVRIAAEHARSGQAADVSLDRVADTMQQTLDQFLEDHDGKLG